MRKLVFIVGAVLFVAAHSVATLGLWQYAHNAPDGAAAGVARALAVTFALPLLLPLILFDPDGDRLPRWFQVASVPLNSLMWWAAVLLLVAFKRRRAARTAREARGFEVGPVRPG